MSNQQFEHDEFKESYAHYRHLEQERSRHLAFFFAMVGGLLGFLGFLLKDGKPVTGLEWILFVGGLVIVFLQILDTVMFAAIRRIGDARAQHAATMNHLREKLSSDTYVANLWKNFEKRPHVSVQCTAEITLHLFALLFVTTASGGAVYALATGAVFCWQGAVLLSLTAAIAVLHAAVWMWLRPPRKGAT